MLDHLLISPEPGKLRAFIDALEDADYPYLARLLERNERIKQETIDSKKILEIFSPNLEQQLNPMDLVPPLYAARVINIEDKDEITTVFNKLGATSASVCLLGLIQRRLHPDDWYKQFLNILFDVGRSDLATLLEPEYAPDTDLKYPQLQYSSDTDIPHDDPTIADDIATRIKQNNAELVKHLRVPKIITFLVPTIISSDERARFLEMDKQDPIKSVSILLTYILKQKSVVPFAEALRAADYPYLADLLTKNDIHKTYFYAGRFSHRIDIFRPFICRRIDPCIIMPHLCRVGVINYRDKDEILSLKENEGIICSSSHLLECIQCRQSPKIWYSEFLNSLIHCGQEDIANLLEPDYVANSDIWITKSDDCLNEQNGPHLSQETERQQSDAVAHLQKQLEELAKHEQSVLMSETDIREILRIVNEDVKKQKLETEKELARQLSMIMNEIHKQRCVLTDKINGCPDTADNSSENLTNAQVLFKSLQTSDQKLAALKHRQSYYHVYGSVSNNVVFTTNINSSGERIMPLSAACETLGDESGTNPRIQSALTAHSQPSTDGQRSAFRESVETEREKRDEIDKLSDASSNPSSSYFIISKDCLEELEEDISQDRSVLSLSNNGSFLVSEHQGLCLFSDLNVLPNGQYVLADSVHRCVMLFDDQFHFQQELKLNDYPVHISALSSDDVAVHMSNDSNITLWKLQANNTAILEWPCK